MQAAFRKRFSSFVKASITKMTVTEADVGIVVFTTEGAKGFHGIHKQRYSDFIVREVASDGKVAALLDTSSERLEKSLFTAKGKAVDSAVQADAVSLQELPESVAAGLLQISLSKTNTAPTTEMLDIKDRLAAYLRGCIEGGSDLRKDFACFACNDKSTRTQMHQYTREHLSAHVESSTVGNNENTLFVVVARAKGAGGLPQRSDRISSWPQGVPDFLQFTLLKENIDTMSASAVISKHLRLKGSGMQFNGTKDKRGVTAQKCTVYRRRPSELAKLNHGRFPVIRVGDFIYVDKPSRLGSLRGNRFSIVLRDVDIGADELSSVCEAVRSRGFVNYYGLQRFGKGAASHEVGRAIYKKDFRAVVDSIFAPLPMDRADIAQAKVLYAAGDFAAAAKSVPYSMHSERAVLESLAKSSSYAAAFDKVNRNTRLICTHAYQSYFFNLAATERIRRYGLKCVVGDIVRAGDGTREIIDDAPLPPDDITAGAGEAADDDIAEPKGEECVQVRVLTEEDIASKQYCIQDVLLPLLGYDVVLPANDIGEVYLEALAKDDFSLENFRTCLQQYRMPGSYRRLLQFPQDFTFAIASYDDPDAEISTTELSLMRSKDGRSVGSAYVATDAEAEGIIQNNIVSSIVSSGLAGSATGRYRAAILNFTLSSGVYATMLLREITKEDSSQAHQASLTASSSKRHAAENDTEVAKKSRSSEIVFT